MIPLIAVLKTVRNLRCFLNQLSLRLYFGQNSGLLGTQPFLIGSAYRERLLAKLFGHEKRIGIGRVALKRAASRITGLFIQRSGRHKGRLNPGFKR